MQFSSMDNNLDKCSAVKCTAPNPLKKIFFNVSFCIGVSIRIGREIRCLPYAGFFLSAVDTRGVPLDPGSVCRVTGRLGDKGGTVQCTGLGQLTVQLYNPGQVYKGSREF